MYSTSIHEIGTYYYSRHTLVSFSPWSNLTEAEDNIRYYLTVYGTLAGANSLFTLIRAFLFAYGGICAATRVHKLLLSRILKVCKVAYTALNITASQLYNYIFYSCILLCGLTITVHKELSSSTCSRPRLFTYLLICK